MFDGGDNVVSRDWKKVARHKRSTIGRSVIHVNISGFGEKFNLELWENKKLLAPGFKVYHRKNVSNDTIDEEQTSAEELENDLACLYTGNVRNHNNNPVAVNVCDGMVSGDLCSVQKLITCGSVLLTGKMYREEQGDEGAGEIKSIYSENLIIWTVSKPRKLSL